MSSISIRGQARQLVWTNEPIMHNFRELLARWAAQHGIASRMKHTKLSPEEQIVQGKYTTTHV